MIIRKFFCFRPLIIRLQIRLQIAFRPNPTQTNTRTRTRTGASQLDRLAGTYYIYNRISEEEAALLTRQPGAPPPISLSLPASVFQICKYVHTKKTKKPQGSGGRCYISQPPVGVERKFLDMDMDMIYMAGQLAG